MHRFRQMFSRLARSRLAQHFQKMTAFVLRAAKRCRYVLSSEWPKKLDLFWALSKSRSARSSNEDRESRSPDSALAGFPAASSVFPDRDCGASAAFPAQQTKRAAATLDAVVLTSARAKLETHCEFVVHASSVV